MKNVAQAKDNTEQMGHDLTRTGFLRLNSILAPLGPLFPKQVKLGPRTTARKVEDIRDLIERVS
jgi:hypothetical protein